MAGDRMLINDADITKIQVNFRGWQCTSPYRSVHFLKLPNWEPDILAYNNSTPKFPTRLFYLQAERENTFSSKFVYHKVEKQKKFSPKFILTWNLSQFCKNQTWLTFTLAERK